VGTYSGLEEGLVASAGVSFHAISAGKLRRYWSWQNFTDAGRIVRGVLQALLLVRRQRPQVVFSKGGFVSFPVALAAWIWRVPVVAHESDFTPGLANRLVLPFVKTLCVSFRQTQVTSSKAHVVHTGTPLRESILNGVAMQGRALLGLSDNKPLLVVTGGSLGADALNAAVRLALPQLIERFTVLHVCGAQKLRPLDMPGYIQREYIDDGWGDVLAAADVVLSRAGANALFELLALRKLNLLVPLSGAASRGDQIENALFAESAGYSAVLAENELSTENLVAALEELLEQRDRYGQALSEFQMPDASSAIASQIQAAVAS
jgi:UDP-N-acetylglucosamine--N-acetylmuramyl-(pentapeptide) pyrophosphoryl-undecaprenol N-acetylglucosamine transferase